LFFKKNILSYDYLINYFLKMKIKIEIENKTLKILAILLVAVVLCLTLFMVGKNIIQKRNSKGSQVVAKSKVGNITIDDVESYIKNLEKTFGQKIDVNSLKKEEKELIVNEIVNNRVILSKAKKSGIKNDKEYKNKVKELEENLLKETFLQKLIAQNITEKDIRQRYDEVNEILKGKKEYKVKHIVVKTKAEILAAIKELKNKTFEEVAEKYSIDSSKENGGDLGYLIDGQTVKEFNDVVKKQPKNKLSEPFETQFGWHVLIKEDERDATIAKYEDTRNNVREALVRDFIRDYSLNNIRDMNIVILDK